VRRRRFRRRPNRNADGEQQSGNKSDNNQENGQDHAVGDANTNQRPPRNRYPNDENGQQVRRYRPRFGRGGARGARGGAGGGQRINGGNQRRSFNENQVEGDDRPPRRQYGGFRPRNQNDGEQQNRENGGGFRGRGGFRPGRGRYFRNKNYGGNNRNGQSNQVLIGNEQNTSEV